MDDFAEIAAKVFDFLVTGEGFQCEQRSNQRVVYSNKKTVIQLAMGDHGEFGMSFDRIPASRYSYPFEFYLKTFAPNDHSSLGESTAKSRLELEVGLRKLARLLKQHGRPIFDGEASIYERMDSDFRNSHT